MPAARYMNRIWVPAFVGQAYVFSRPDQVARHAIQNYYSVQLIHNQIIRLLIQSNVRCWQGSC